MMIKRKRRRGFSVVRRSDKAISGLSAKISIKCKKEGHEIFKQKPTKDLQGDGCPKCGRIKTITKHSSTKEYFIKKSKEAHPNKNYGYHKVDYNGDAKNVIIV